MDAALTQLRATDYPVQDEDIAHLPEIYRFEGLGKKTQNDDPTTRIAFLIIVPRVRIPWNEPTEDKHPAGAGGDKRGACLRW